MKNAIKFEKAKSETLTEKERKMIECLVNEICDAHENDKWWKVDLCIKSWVHHYLLSRAAHEEYAEFCEKDESDE